MAQQYNHNLSFVSPSATPSCTPYNELASIYGNGQFYGTALGEPLINFEVVSQQPYDSRSTTPNNVQQNGNTSRNSQEVESIVEAISNRFNENEDNIKKEIQSLEKLSEERQKKLEDNMKAFLETVFVAISNQSNANVNGILERMAQTEERQRKAIETLDLKVKNLDNLLEHKNRQLEELNKKFLELKSQKEKSEITEVTSDAIVNCMQGLTEHIVTDLSTKVLGYLDEHCGVNDQICGVDIKDQPQQEQTSFKQVVQQNNSEPLGTSCQFTSIDTQVPKNTSNVYTPGPQENLKNVKLFKIGDSADQWVTNFKYQSKFRNIPPSEWPRVMGLHMDWTAIAKYNSLLESQKAFVAVIDDESKFTIYEKIFIKEFEVVDNDSRVLSEIKSLEYRNFINKNDYWNNLRNLVIRLNNTSTAVIYNLIHEKFPHHIKNAINTNVGLMREDPQTFIQSIQTICQNMSLTKSNDHNRQDNKIDHQKSWTFRSKTFGMNSERSNERYSEVQCFTCGQFGHMSRQCPQMDNQQQRPPTPPDSGNEPGRL